MGETKKELLDKMTEGWRQSENLWMQSINLHKSSARFLGKMLTTMEDLIKSLEGHQSTIHFSKGLSLVGGVTGTALLFTPLFWGVGAGVAATSAMTGVGTSVHDVLVTGRAQEKIKEYRELATEYSKQLEKSLQEFKKILEKMNITVEASVKFFGKNEYVAAAKSTLAIAGTLTTGLAALNNSISATAIGAVFGVVIEVFSENKSLQNARLLVSEIRDNIEGMERTTKSMNGAMKKLETERMNLEIKVRAM